MHLRQTTQEKASLVCALFQEVKPFNIHLGGRGMRVGHMMRRRTKHGLCRRNIQAKREVRRIVQSASRLVRGARDAAPSDSKRFDKHGSLTSTRGYLCTI